MLLFSATAFAVCTSLLIVASIATNRILYRLIAMLISLISIWFKLSEFLDFMYKIIFNGPSPYIIVYWILVLTMLLPIPFIARSPTHSPESKIVLWRKFFHLIVLVLFTPPLVADWEEFDQLIAIAGVLVLCVFVIMEAIRITGKPWVKLSQGLNHLMRPLLDYKDKGSRIVTSHMELLFAVVFPVWVGQVVGGELNRREFVLSGILTVGVGDSAAAVGGICITGKPHKLPCAPNSKKSIEGFVCFVLAVNTALWIFDRWDSLSFVSSMIAGIAESYIIKYDNTFLPLVYSFSRLLLGRISA